MISYYVLLLVKEQAKVVSNRCV